MKSLFKYKLNVTVFTTDGRKAKHVVLLENLSIAQIKYEQFMKLKRHFREAPSLDFVYEGNDNEVSIFNVENVTRVDVSLKTPLFSF